MTKTILENDFANLYYHYCRLYNLTLNTNLITTTTTLALNTSKIQRDQDWPPILKALQKSKLKEIVLYATEENHQLYRILPELVAGVKECLGRGLAKLVIEGIIMKERVLKILSKVSIPH